MTLNVSVGAGHVKNITLLVKKGGTVEPEWKIKRQK